MSYSNTLRPGLPTWDGGDLGQTLEAARKGILQMGSDDEIRYWCQMVMTRLYQASLCLAGSEAGFLRRYPHQSAAFLDAKQLSQKPSAHIGRLLPLLKTFGRWLVRVTQERDGKCK